MLPLTLYKLEVQQRGVRIHVGTYPWDPFRANSEPLVAQSSGLVLHSDLDKSYPKPICQHHSGQPHSLVRGAKNTLKWRSKNWGSCCSWYARRAPHLESSVSLGRSQVMEWDFLEIVEFDSSHMAPGLGSRCTTQRTLLALASPRHRTVT